MNQAISPEQLNQIVEAILDGKYSWACVLLLRCAGHNPLHYIPYRTYNRLLKENCQIGSSSEYETTKINPNKKPSQTKSKGTFSGKHLPKIRDLAYLEEVTEQKIPVRGGHVKLLLESNSQEAKCVLSKYSVFFEGNWSLF